MEQEKKNNFPWETLDTTTIMNPDELLSYLLYMLSLRKNNKRLMTTLASYAVRDAKKKEETSKCFQK